ncbi:MAG: hypothetical protein ABIH86_04100 [Planctomycetota bacterium]
MTLRRVLFIIGAIIAALGVLLVCVFAFQPERVVELLYSSDGRLTYQNDWERWRIFLALAGAGLFTALAYSLETAKDIRKTERAILSVLRFGALCLLLIAWLDPVVERFRDPDARAVIGVLVDRSASMALPERTVSVESANAIRAVLPPDARLISTVDPTLSVEARTFLARNITPDDLLRFSRLDSLNAIFSQSQFNNADGQSERFLARLSSGGRTVLAVPYDDGRIDSVLSPSSDGQIPVIASRGGGTALATGIRALLERVAATNSQLDYVIVFSDGQDIGSRADRDRALQDIRQIGAESFFVPVGVSRRPQDLRIVSVETDAEITSNKQYMTIRVFVGGSDIDDADATLPVVVELRDSNNEPVSASAIATIASGAERPGLPSVGDIASRVVEIIFTVKPPDRTIDENGNPVNHRWSAVVETPAGLIETHRENNTKAFQFTVRDRKLRILYAEGISNPRWEYRYLKNILKRDSGIVADILMARADGSWLWDGSPSKPPCNAFPDTLDAMTASYDIIILGDIPPDRFTDAQIDAMEAFVGINGGGLILLAGPRGAYSAWKDTALARALPVILPDRVPPAGDPLTVGYRIVLTQAGETADWLKLSADPEKNKRLIESFPELFWFARPVRARAIAQPLIVHPTEVGDDGAPHPLLVKWTYHRGQTMFIGFDELWRLRYGYGDYYHTKLWLNILSALRGQSSYRLDVETERCEVGGRVKLSARVVGADGGAPGYDAIPVRASLYPAGSNDESALSPDNASLDTLELTLRTTAGESAGEFAGAFTPPQDGVWRLDMINPDNPSQIWASRLLTATPALTETANAHADAARMKTMADRAGGIVVPLEKLGDICDAISDPELPPPLRRQEPRDALDAFILLAFCVLLITEWSLRKTARMT